VRISVPGISLTSTRHSSSTSRNTLRQSADVPEARDGLQHDTHGRLPFSRAIKRRNCIT
jgi:hypothetical protein